MFKYRGDLVIINFKSRYEFAASLLCIMYISKSAYIFWLTIIDEDSEDANIFNPCVFCSYMFNNLWPILKNNKQIRSLQNLKTVTQNEKSEFDGLNNVLT